MKMTSTDASKNQHKNMVISKLHKIISREPNNMQVFFENKKKTAQIYQFKGKGYVGFKCVSTKKHFEKEIYTIYIIVLGNVYSNGRKVGFSYAPDIDEFMEWTLENLSTFMSSIRVLYMCE